jgi:hypothetical protein
MMLICCVLRWNLDAKKLLEVDVFLTELLSLWEVFFNFEF